MKCKIISAALLSFIFVASSFAAKPEPVNATRDITITAPFNRIIVDNTINIILIQNDSKSSLTVSGDEKSIANVDAAIVKGQLQISTKKHLQGKKITVYIPVKDLAVIELLNGSSVSGDGILKFLDLTVIVNNGCHVALNTLGNIDIQSNDDSDFVYEKNEKYKVLPATL